ncbi:MAG: Calx-beta domain-containing protein [Marinoscillum sp.]
MTVSINTGSTTDALYDVLANKTITATNTDNDTAGFTLGATTASTSEDGSGQNVTLVLASEPIGTVTFTISDDGGNDEVSFTTSRSFDNTDWSTTKNIVLAGLDDAIVDGNILESLTITVTSAPSDANYLALGTQSIDVTNSDDDAATISIADVSVDEGNSGTTSATFNVTLSADVDQTVTVNYTTSNASATTADSDYTAASNTVTFTGGTAGTETITINVLGDTKVEDDQTFRVTLSSVVAGGKNVTISDALAIGTIRNDDVASIAIGDVSKNEDDDTFSFDVTLTGTVDQTFTVDFATSDNTAEDESGDGDYDSNSGTLNFAANTTGEVQSAVITVNGDAKLEGDETFYVTLSNLQANNKNVVISDASGLGTIINEDDAPTFTSATQFDDDDNGELDRIVITMNENVDETSVVIGDFTINGSGTGFTYTNDGSNDGVFTFDLTSEISGTSTVTVAYSAGSLIDIEGTLAEDNTDITQVDLAVPVVTSVTSSTANGYYSEGDVIAIQVTFSEIVNVTGTPQLTVNATATAVDYTSGTGTNTLTFNYTVGVSDASTDLGYATTTDLTLNGGTILDASSNAADLTLPANAGGSSLSDQKNIVVDNTHPVVAFAYSPGTSTNASSVSFTLTFDTDVNTATVSSSDITINTTGTVGYSSTSLTGPTGVSNHIYTYTVSGIVSSGTISITLSTSGIQDDAGNDLTGTVTSDDITIDKSASIAISTIEDDDYVNGTEDDANIIISGTSSDVDAGQGVTISISDGSTTVDPEVGTEATIAGDGTWSYSFDIAGSGLDETTITVDVSVDDLAGNNATDSRDFIYDATATVAINATLEGDNYVKDSESEDVVAKGAVSNVENAKIITITFEDIDGLTATATATVNGGTWTASEVDFKAEGFATGNITVDATVEDAAENVANAAQRTIVYDTLNQVFIAATQMDDNIISGSEASNVTITGTSNGLDGNTISVTITDGSTTTTAATGTSGTGTGASWTVTGIDITSLIEGTISVNVSVTDDAGNTATASKSLKYDESATVAISTPIEGDGYVNNTEATTVVVSGTTTGVENGNNVTVTFSDADGGTADITTSLPSVSSNAWTTADIDLSALTDGTVTVTANVSDNAGNAATQASTTITLDRSVTISIDTYDANVNASEDNSLTVSGSTDAEDGQTVTINFDDGSNDLSKSATVASGAWTVTGVNVSGLDDGTITITADVTDLAGNSGSANVNFALDKTANIAIASTLMTDNVINASEATSVTISGTSGSIENGRPVNVSITDGTNTFDPSGSETTVDGSGNWTYTFDISSTSLTETDLDITVTSADVAGNSATATKTIHYDATATIALTTPISIDNILNASEDGGLIIKGTTTDVETGLTVTITYNDGSNPVVNASAVVSSGSWTASGADISGLDEGTITISYSVSDNAGNTASATHNITLDQTADVAISTPIATNGIVNASEESALLTISGTTTDIDDAQTLTLTISDGTTSLTPTTTVTSNAWSITGIDLSTLDEGGIDITASVSDVAGNSTTDEVSITLDRTISIAITTPIEDDDRVSNTESSTVVVSGTAGGVEAGKTVNVVFTDGSAATVNANATVSGGSWSTGNVDISGLTDGSINVQASVTDNAANSASSSTTITLDKVASVAISTPIEVDGKVNASEDNDVQISGIVTNIEDGQTVSVTLDDSNSGTSSVTVTAIIASGAWTTSDANISNLDDGSITVNVSVSDVTGNTATASTTIELDNDFPQLSSIGLLTNNGTDDQHGADGDVVTLTFTSSDDLSSDPVVTFTSGGVDVNGAISVDNSSAPTYTATYTIDGSSDTEGGVGFTINFTDDAGNVGTQVSSVTDASSVEVDFNAPELLSSSITTNNTTDNEHAKGSDVVTLSFETNDELSATPEVSMTINNTPVVGGVTVTNTTGNNYEAKFTVDAAGLTVGTDIDDQGLVGYEIDFIDDAGNEATQVSVTSVVEVDFTSTELNPIILTSNNLNNQHAAHGDVVTLRFTSSDELSATPTVSMNVVGIAVVGGVTVTNTSGNEYEATFTVDGDGVNLGTDKDNQGAVGFSITAVDDAGNSKTSSTVTNGSSIEVDYTKPTLSGISLATNNGTDDEHGADGDVVTLTFTSDDDLSSNPVVTFTSGGDAVNGAISVDNSSAPTYTATYTIDGSTDTEGFVGYEIAYTDDAGNAGTNVAVATSSVEVDFVAPTVETLTISSNNGTDDEHGAEGDEVTITIDFDDDLSAPPTFMIKSGNPEITNTPIVTEDNSTEEIWEITYTVDAADIDGAVTFEISFVDDAGNSGVLVTHADITDGSVMEIDKVAPTLTSVSLSTDNGTDDQHATTGDVVTLRFVSDDDLSAIPKVDFTSGGTPLNSTRVMVSSLGGNSYEATYTVLSSDVDGAVTFTIDYVDDAGNNGSQVTAVTDVSSVEVDKVKPFVTFSHSLENPTNEDPFDITATFDEQITGLTTDDFIITNGAVVSITDANPVFTVRIDPTNGTDANVSIVLDAGKVFDDAGNTNNASSAYNIAFDDVPPVPTLDTLYLVGRTVNMDITLDEVGNLYYAVLPGGSTITNAELMDTISYGGTIIYYGTVLSDDEFSEEFTLTSATDQTDYVLFYAVEDLVDSQNLSSVFSQDIKTGGVEVEAPNLVDICIDGDYLLLDDIRVGETIATDFVSSGSDRTLTFGLPENFTFNKGTGSATVNSGDLTIVSRTYNTAGNELTVRYRASSMLNLDTLTISNLEVKVVNSDDGDIQDDGVTSAEMTRVGGSGDVYLANDGDSRVFATFTSVPPFNAPIIIKPSDTPPADQPYIIETDSTVLGESRGDGVVVYDYDAFDNSRSPMTIGSVNSGDEISIYYNTQDSLVTSYTLTSASDEYSPTLSELKLTKDNLGINTYLVTVTDGKTCESATSQFSIAVIRYTNSSGVTTFQDDDATGTNFRFTYPSGYSAFYDIDTEGNVGLFSTVTDTFLIAPFDRARRVRFRPDAGIDAGRYNVKYTLTKTSSGISAEYWISVLVNSTSGVFTVTDYRDNGLCADNISQEVEIAPIADIDVGLGSDTTSNPNFSQIRVFDFEDGSRGDDLTEMFLLASPTLDNSTATSATGWTLNLDTANSVFGTAYSKQIQVVLYVTEDVAPYGETELTSEEIIIYKAPEISFTNISSFICEDETGFDLKISVRAQGINLTGNGVGDTLTTGYELFKFDGTDYVSVLDTSGTFFNPQDVDLDGDSTENESGQYRLVHTSKGYTTAECGSTVTFDFELLSKPTLPTITNDLTNVGGLIDLDGDGDVDDYLLEFRQGDTVPNLTAGLVGVDTILWYNDSFRSAQLTSGGTGGSVLTPETLFGTKVPTSLTRRIYFSQRSDVEANGSTFEGCESELRALEIRVRAVPNAPQVNTALINAVNTNETNLGVIGVDEDDLNVISQGYAYEYCVEDDGSLISLEDIIFSNITTTSEPLETYFTIYDEDAMTELDTVQTGQILSSRLETVLSYSPTAGSGVRAFYVSRTDFDNDPSNDGPEFNGCESELRKFTLNVFAIPAAPVDSLFRGGENANSRLFSKVDNEMNYYLCAGDKDAFIQIESPGTTGSSYTWYTDETLSVIMPSDAVNNRSILLDDLTGFSDEVTTTTTNTYYVTQTRNINEASDFLGCESDPVAVNVTVFPDPVQLTFDEEGDRDLIKSYCEGSLSSVFFDLTGSANSTFSFYSTNAAGNSLESAATPIGDLDISDSKIEVTASALQLTNRTEGTYYFLISQTGNIRPDGSTFLGCESEISEMAFLTVNIYDIPVHPKVTDGITPIEDEDFFYCESDALLTGITLQSEGLGVSEELRWYITDESFSYTEGVDVVTTGNSVTPEDLQSLFGLDGSSGSGAYYIAVSQTQDLDGGVVGFEGCSSEPLMITIIKEPSAPDVTSPNPRCYDDGNQTYSATYSGDAVVVGGANASFQWYASEVSGSFKVIDGVTYNPSNPNSPEGQNIQAFNYTQSANQARTGQFGVIDTIWVSQKVTVGSVECEGVRTPVAINIYPRPEIVRAGTNQLSIVQACDEQEVSMEVELANLSTANASFIWYGGETAPGQELKSGTLEKINDSIARYTFEPILESSVSGNPLIEAGNNFFRVEIIDDRQPSELGESCYGEAERTIEIGTTPQPQIRWDGITQGRTTDFIFRDLNPTVSQQYDIEYVELAIIELDTILSLPNGLTNPNSTDTLSFSFENAGVYELQIYYRSSSKCDATITRVITILEKETVTDEFLHDFDVTGILPYQWVVDSTIYSQNDPQNSGWTLKSSLTWQRGSESNTYGGEIDGNQTSHWATNLDDDYTAGASEWIYSPAFDLSQMELPTLSFSQARDLTNQDAVVIEYSEDDGRSWLDLGAYNSVDGTGTGSGKNWYNSSNLPSNPGVSVEGENRQGWSESVVNSSDSQSGWITSAHKLQPWENVRFRFSFASTAGVKEGLDGFAFDDFRIFNRDKRILIEQFSVLSNSTKDNDNSRIANDSIYARTTGTLANDAIWINYYSDQNGESPLTLRNSSDPGARAGYYGISQSPKSVLTGESNFNSSVKPGWTVDEFNAVALDDAEFEINLNVGGASDEITINASFTSLVDISGNNTEVSFRFAIIERVVTATELTDLNGGRPLYNVLRKMLPSSAGFTHVGAVQEGQNAFFNGSNELSMTWKISQVYDPEQLSVIAFVQLDNTSDPAYKTKTRRVMQAVKVDLSGKVEAVVAGEKRNLAIDQFEIYPNPANSSFKVQLEVAPKDEMNWIVYDQVGRRVLGGFVKPGDLEVEVNSKELPSGVYMIHFFNSSEKWLPKRLIIIH